MHINVDKCKKGGSTELPFLWFSVFSLHCIAGNNPLFAEFFYINTIFQFAVRYGFSQCAFAQSPKCSRISKGNEMIKSSLVGVSIFP